MLLNKNLEKLQAEVRRLFDKATSDNTWAIYKSKLMQYNKEISKAKRDSWGKFSEELQETLSCPRIHFLPRKAMLQP